MKELSGFPTSEFWENENQEKAIVVVVSLAS